MSTDTDTLHQATIDAGAPGATINPNLYGHFAAASITSHNTVQQPAAVQPEVFDGCALTGGGLRLELPAKSVVAVTLETPS